MRLGKLGKNALFLRHSEGTSKLNVVRFFLLILSLEAVFDELGV
jgi:hypothetical protein